MAHHITQRDDGTAEAAFALQPAWHGLGTVLDHAMTSQEALSAAQLDWRVVQFPLAFGKPMILPSPDGPVERKVYFDIENQLANVREDTGLFLGCVSDRYQIVQNAEAFTFLDALVEEGEITYESAFSLSGGKQVVLLARMPGMDFVSDEDGQLRYILMGLHHDGSGAIRFGATSVRVVCANTYGLALKRDGRTVRELSIRHTGNVSEKLQEARTILGLAQQEFADYADNCRRMAECRLTRDQWQEFLDVMCPVPSRVDPDWSAKRELLILETRQQIAANFYTDERNALNGIEETAWAAFNAVTQHVDHLPRRGASSLRRAEARFNVTQYGPGRDQKERAFAAACRLAGVA